jgi:hypothetical protein
MAAITMAAKALWFTSEIMEEPKGITIKIIGSGQGAGQVRKDQPQIQPGPPRPINITK